MTPQSSFMIVSPILTEQRDSLETLLASMNAPSGQADPRNEVIPFGNFDTLHNARLLIIEANTASDIEAFGWQPHEFAPVLAFLGEVDGDRDTFLAHLAIVASTGLSRLFSHCNGFETHKGTLLAFLQTHSAPSAATYINWIGRTVIQVHEESRLQAFLAETLDSLQASSEAIDVRQLRQALSTAVELAIHEGKLTLTPESPTPWSYRFRTTLDLVGFPLIVLALSPVLLLASPFVLWRLRSLEQSDPDIDLRPDPAHVDRLSVIEDVDVSNQFNVFGDVKPGLFRYYLLKAIMRVVDYTARHVYKRGFLGRVRTIHCARWVFLNDRRSMFFASLYDGSLESYMDDFINKVAFGLNLTFSHGVGYPRTRWMIKGGAELEQPFKDTLRRHQLPSAVWYRAHPGLTAFDMARNTRLRQGLERYPRNDAAIRHWLDEF